MCDFAADGDDELEAAKADKRLDPTVARIVSV
jgi:hypothetical protein